MKITRNGAVPSKPGPESYFTGQVRMDMEFNTESPARVGGVTVTFEPGARTAWHTHPLGQTLIVTAGLGWARIEGEPKQEIRPGDIVWLISTSGNSPNVLEAARVAAGRGALLIGFTGQTGGKLADLCTHVFRSPHTASERIQEAHSLAYHYICERVEAAFA